MANETKTATPASGEVSSARPLLAAPPRVINIGLQGFAAELASNGTTVVHVAWSPPARGNAKLAALLAKLGS